MSVFLQEEINEKIKIYELNPIPEKMYNYKEEQMRQVPLDMRVFRARTSDVMIRPLQNEARSVNYDALGFAGQTSREHEMISPRLTEEEFSRQNSVLANYYGDCCPIETILEVYNNRDKDIHYLLPLGNYHCGSYGYYIDSVLNIPRSLFHLNEFLKSNFDLLTEDEISKILDLFEVKHLEPLDIQSLKRFSELGIIIPDYKEYLKRQINKSASILKLMKH